MYTTPFTHLHIALGAKMAEFAGYNMPIQYTGITDEHLCVRQRVSMFDVSRMEMGQLQLDQAENTILVFNERPKRNC